MKTCKNQSDVGEHIITSSYADLLTHLHATAGHENNALKKLQQSLALERLLVDISARLISSPLEAIDDEIEKALNLIRNFFQVDTCVLLEVQENRSVVRVSHAAYAEGIDEVPGDINLTVLYPWAYEMLVVH